ncbi:MAG: transglycosylase SLT domain-containing protein [Geminicoccaceae bacterium]
MDLPMMALRASRWILAFSLLLATAAPAFAAQGPNLGTVAQIAEAADDGDFAMAERIAANSQSPLLQVYAAWRELLESETRLPFSSYQHFLDRYPDWPSLGALQIKGEQSLDDSVPYATRLAFFARHPPLSKEGRISYADALLQAGKTGEATKLLRRVWAEDEFAMADGQAFYAQYSAYLRSADHAARLDRLLWAGETGAATRMLELVGPREQAVGRARIALQNNDKNVLQLFNQVPPDARSESGMLYDRYQWRQRRGSETDAWQLLTQLPPRLSHPEAWWKVQQRAIRDALDAGNPRLAYQIAARHRQPTGSSMADAEWLAGYVALRYLKQPVAASQHFQAMAQAVRTPISRGRAAYWAGRAAEAAGDQDAATAWYQSAAANPTSFYGQMAAAEIGVDIRSQLPRQAGPSQQAIDIVLRRPSAQMARVLCRLPESDHAQPFFRHLGVELAASREGLGVVAAIAEECHRPDLTLIASRAATANGGTFVLRASYPMLPQAVMGQMKDLPLDVATVMAVARQESLFNADARSPAGALGLLQLMPGTAQQVSREIGIPYSRQKLLDDPVYNARLGSFYLRRQMERFDGEPALAIAAYNAGPGRVSTWIEENGDPRGRDANALVDWIESIPFSETRNYVQRVMEARNVYAAMLGRKGVAVASESQ